MQCACTQGTPYSVQLKPAKPKSTKLEAKRNYRNDCQAQYNSIVNLCYSWSDRKRVQVAWSKKRRHVYVIYFGFAERSATASQQQNQRNQGQLSGASGGTLCIHVTSAHFFRLVLKYVLETVSAADAGLAKTAAVLHNIHACMYYIEFKLQSTQAKALLYIKAFSGR